MGKERKEKQQEGEDDQMEMNVSGRDWRTIMADRQRERSDGGEEDKKSLEMACDG